MNLKNRYLVFIFLLFLVTISCVSAVSNDTDNSVYNNQEEVSPYTDSDDYNDIKYIENTDSQKNINKDSNYTPKTASNSIVITKDNYDLFYQRQSNSSMPTTTDYIKSGDVIKLKGTFTNVNFTVDKKLELTSYDSSTQLINCTVFIIGSNSSNSIVSDLKITNNGTLLRGIQVKNSSNLRIENNTIKTYGLRSYGFVADNMNKSVISGNTFKRSGDDWRYITFVIGKSHYNNITNNSIECGGANGIYLSVYGSSEADFDGGPSNYNNIIANNVSARGNITSWCYTIQVMGANNNIINNTVDGGFRGISTQDYENNVISGNDVHAINTGIYACEKAKISNNYVHVNDSAFGITVGGDNVEVVNNTISSTQEQAIEIRADNVYIADNNITSTSSYGIHSKGKYSNIIIDNNKIISELEGILFKRQSYSKRINNVLISRNNIISQSDYAINLLEAGSSVDSEVNITVTGSNVLKSGKGSGMNAYLKPENVNEETLFDSNQTITITESNYNSYFNDGIINSKVEQNATIYLKGSFNNHNFTFNKKVHVIGKNCTVNNGSITLTGDAHLSTVKDININNNRKDTICHGIEIIEVNNCQITNVSINILAESESLGIFVYGANGNRISKSNIITNSDYINNAILLYSSDSNILEDNTIHIKQSNIPLAYDDSIMFNERIGSITEVLHNHGIILLYSSSNTINNNTVKATSGFKKYTFPSNDCKNSMVGIDIYFDSHHNLVENNSISFTSYCPYIYAMGVLGGNWGSSITSVNATSNIFRYNNVNITGGYFATGFIAGRNSINTIVDSNNISVSAVHNSTNKGDYSHAVTLENSTKSNITKNNITVIGASSYPIELFDSSYNNIRQNNIITNATKPYGISGYRTSYNNITQNNITLRVLNYGNPSSAAHSDVIESGDEGIMLSSESYYNNITLNMIDSNATYTIRLDKNTGYNNVTNNSLKAKTKTADKSVSNNVSTNKISNNFLYFINLSSNNITARLGDYVNFTANISTQAEDTSNITVSFKLGTNTIGVVNVINNTATLRYQLSNLWNPTVYTLTITAQGNNFQNTTIQRQAHFYRDPLNTTVSVAKVLQKAGYNATITANITTVNGGNIGTGQADIYLDNKKLATVKLNLGKITYNYPISSNATPSVHTIKVVYNGTEDYKSSTGTNKLGIQSISQITSKNYTATIGENVTFNANILSGNKSVQKGKLKIYLADKLIAQPTFTDGILNYTHKIDNSINQGNYNLTFIYEGNDTTSRAEKLVNIKINTMKTTFEYNKTTVLINTNASLLLNINNGKSEEEYPADGGNVTIKLNNKLLQESDGSIITGTVKNGSIKFKFTVPEQLKGNNNITFIYSGNSQFKPYTQTYTNGLIVAEKLDTKIKVETTRGVIGNKLTLNATVTDVNNEKVINGYVIFKLNGITIKSNGKLTGSNDNLKVYVKNGTATATVTADLNMRHAKNLTAVYAGSSTYNASRSNTATAEIALRNASITVKSNVKTAKQGQNITLTATVKDMLRDNGNLQSYNGQYVFFKVNGITLKDSNGKTLQAKITNGTATAKYMIPLTLSGVTDTKTLNPKNHTITAGFYNPNYYPDARANSTFQTERSNITINITKAIINTKTNKLSLNATFKDYLGNLVSGPNKCIIKINGVTLKNGNNPQYFQANNGKLLISDFNITKQAKYTSIEIVTQDRLSYKSSRTTCCKITVL